MPQKDYEELISKIPENKIICRENVKGYDYVRTDWETLVYTFPDRWIVYTNSDIIKDDRSFLCTVIAICNNDNIFSVKAALLRSGYHVGSLRTTDGRTGVELL